MTLPTLYLRPSPHAYRSLHTPIQLTRGAEILHDRPIETQIYESHCAWCWTPLLLSLTHAPTTCSTQCAELVATKNSIPDVESIRELLPLDGTREEKYKRNNPMIHDIQLREIGTGCFTQFAMINHSCTPNAIIQFTAGDADRRMIVRAIRNIERDEEITVSYIDVMQSTQKRQKILQEMYGFRCRCSRCIEIDEYWDYIEPMMDMTIEQLEMPNIQTVSKIISRILNEAEDITPPKDNLLYITENYTANCSVLEAKLDKREFASAVPNAQYIVVLRHLIYGSVHPMTTLAWIVLVKCRWNAAIQCSLQEVRYCVEGIMVGWGKGIGRELLAEVAKIYEGLVAEASSK